MLDKEYEKYCPACRTTHVFILTPQGWRCNAASQPLHFTESELVQAFLNLRNDPEYITKGISVFKTTSTKMTLPTDSQERKSYPLLSGCLKYFAAALAGVARTSKNGNDKHNPGQPLHHARGKSSDHGDCIVRHLMDVEDMLAANARFDKEPKQPSGAQRPFTDRQILDEAGSLAWRALAYSQELHEKLGAAPLAPAAK